MTINTDIRFQTAEVSPTALTPSCWGWLCAWGQGVVSIPSPCFFSPAGLQNPRKRTKFHIPAKKNHSNKGKDSVNLKGNIFPCLFGYVSLPKVISSVLRDKIFTLIFEKLFHSLVDVTARRCSLLLSVNNTF